MRGWRLLPNPSTHPPFPHPRSWAFSPATHHEDDSALLLWRCTGDDTARTCCPRPVVGFALEMSLGSALSGPVVSLEISIPALNDSCGWGKPSLFSLPMKQKGKGSAHALHKTGHQLVSEKRLPFFPRSPRDGIFASSVLSPFSCGLCSAAAAACGKCATRDKGLLHLFFFSHDCGIGLGLGLGLGSCGIE